MAATGAGGAACGTARFLFGFVTLPCRFGISRGVVASGICGCGLVGRIGIVGFARATATGCTTVGPTGTGCAFRLVVTIVACGSFGVFTSRTVCIRRGCNTVVGRVFRVFGVVTLLVVALI